MPPALQCAVHGTRPAFARCIPCKKTLCQECATQWEGIWHCAACLTAKRGVAGEPSGRGAWVAVIVVTLLFLFLGARLMVWTGAVISGLF